MAAGAIRVPAGFRRILLGGILLFCASFAGLVLAEVLLRAVGYAPASALFGNGTPGRDVQMDWDVTYQFDRRGLRTICGAPESGTGRTIAVIGDSFAFGQGIPNCQDFVSHLQAMDPDARYLNLARPGFGIDAYLVVARDFVPSDSSDVIVLLYGNDISILPDRPWFSWLADNYSTFAVLRRVGQRYFVAAATPMSRQFNNIKNNMITRGVDAYLRVVGADPAQQQKFAEKFAMLMAAIRTSAPQAAIWVAMVPEGMTVSDNLRAFILENGGKVAEKHSAGSNYALVRQLTSDEGANWIDLAPRFFAHDGDDLYWPHDAHWSAQGGKFAAETVRSEMVSRKRAE